MNLRLRDNWPCLGRTDGGGVQEKMDMSVDKLILEREKRENKQEQGLEEGEEVGGERKREEMR